MSNAKRFKVQLIADEGKWPYVGDARKNKDGSINVYLDAKDELVLKGGQKLRLRPARESKGE